MTAAKRSRNTPLDALVVKVYQVDLSECSDEQEFKAGIQLVLHNLDAVMEALDCLAPQEPRIRRAADRLKLKAVRLRRLCVAVPESFDDPAEWRWVATQIIANYEQFRIDAGLLYRMAVPCAGFGVLRAAL